MALSNALRVLRDDVRSIFRNDPAANSLPEVLLYPGLEDPATGYLRAVMDLLPTGLKGLLVAAFAVALLAAFFIFVWSVYRTVLRSPDQVSLFFRHRRSARGYLAISRGLIAIGSGDVRTAQMSAAEAARICSDSAVAKARTRNTSHPYTREQARSGERACLWSSEPTGGHLLKVCLNRC